MFNSNYTAVDYLLVVLMLVFLVAVMVLRNSFLSFLRSVRHAKTEHNRAVGNAERNSSTVNDAGEVDGAERLVWEDGLKIYKTRSIQ